MARTKKSKEGFLSVELADGDCAVVVAETLEAYGKNLEKSMLKTHYGDGVLSRFDSLREMRERTAKAETQWIGKDTVVAYDNVRKRKAEAAQPEAKAKRQRAGNRTVPRLAALHWGEDVDRPLAVCMGHGLQHFLAGRPACV